MSMEHTAVKAPVFPFNRFPGTDVLLGPEMRSTGEVMGLDKDVAQAYAKAQLGAGINLPTEGTVFISVKDSDKENIVAIARELADIGFSIVSTGGTAKLLKDNGLEVTRVNKVMEGHPHIGDSIINGDVKLMINTTTKGPQALTDSLSIRRLALAHKIPCFTLLTAARAGVQAIRAMKSRSIDVKPIQKYFVVEQDVEAAE
jgi:carbamoyl-phosphate synthase large subunit